MHQICQDDGGMGVDISLQLANLGGSSSTLGAGVPLLGPSLSTSSSAALPPSSSSGMAMMRSAP